MIGELKVSTDVLCSSQPAARSDNRVSLWVTGNRKQPHPDGKPHFNGAVTHF